MKFIDLENWDRAIHYHIFRNNLQPHYIKKILRRICAVLCMATVIFGMTGCSGVEDVEQTKTQQETEHIPSQEKNQENEQTEDIILQEEIEIPDEIVDYGDSITFSCNITEQPIKIWEGDVEAIFQVATTSEQFRNEFEPSEEATMKNVEVAIGKTVGETFTLWKEGGDGLYGYEYTIQEIVDKPADKVAYGDKVYTSYSMKANGVDRGDDIQTGEQVIHVINTDKFLASEEIGYSVDAAERRINNIIGKGVGDTFRVEQEAPEWSESYLYTIARIDKAVEYGDTIKAAMRRAYIFEDDMEAVSSHESIELELLTPTGMINFAGNELNMADTMRFLKELQGKTIGDRIVFSTISDSQKRTYDITVLEITSGEPVEEYFDVEALMLSEEKNSVYFYDDNENAPIYYAVVKDLENNMICEYSGGSGNSYFLEYRYGYEPEYDTQGRLIKETYSGGREKICEYQYNEQGVCTEVITNFPYADIVNIDYYDDAGVLIKTEELYGSGSKKVIEYANGSNIYAKETEYDVNGNVVNIREYDEWGFLIEP